MKPLASACALFASGFSVSNEILSENYFYSDTSLAAAFSQCYFLRRNAQDLKSIFCFSDGIFFSILTYKVLCSSARKQLLDTVELKLAHFK